VNTLLIRRFVRRIIQEKAKSVSSAQSSGLALFLNYPSGYGATRIILYNPSKLLDIFEETFGNPTTEEITHSILGVVETEKWDGSPCNNVGNVINATAAEKGWGPLLYDVALSISNGGLMPDRGSVSSKASSVWNYYDKKRGDVKSIPLDNEDDPKTPSPKDDCPFVKGPEYVNKVYKMTGSGVNVGDLARNHNVFIEQMKKNYKEASKEAVESMVARSALQFFTSKYDG